MPEREEYSLYTLTELVRHTISATFEDPLWVIAEVNRVSFDSRRGHVYMELVEKDKETDHVIAQMRATVWSSNRSAVIQKFELFTGQEFRAGIKILVRGYVNYHNVYGLSFNIIDIDPEYTLGDIHRRKMEVIRQLKEEGIFEMNKELDLPLVIQRIAVISSAQAAGYEDFVNHLENNSYGFAFYHELFTVYVQGENAEASIIAALDRIYSRIELFDVVVIIRGGGSRTDLSAFDSYDLAANVAQFPIPVITGIGHTRDESVVDMVAHMSLKTPTAVADFIVSRAADFAAEVFDMRNRIIRASQMFMANKKLELTNLNNSFREGVRNFLWQHRYSLQSVYSRIRSAPSIPAAHRRNLLQKWDRLVVSVQNAFSARYQQLEEAKAKLNDGLSAIFEKQRNSLEKLAIIIRQNDPKNVLKKGYSITLHNGKALTSASEVKSGDVIETQLFDGKILSEVKSKFSEE